MNYLKRLKRNPNSDKAEIYEDLPDLLPVLKARVADQGNVYFIPVSNFPISESERNRLKLFVDKLHLSYADLIGRELSGCLGVVSEVLEFDIIEKIGVNSFDWQPKMAIALNPELPPPHIPGREEALAWKEGFPVHQVMPMISYITKKSIIGEAYNELFGCGGTIFYSSTLNSDKFFEKNKDVFGYRITDKCFQLMECLPMMGLNTFLEATTNQFRALYSSMGLYVCESKRDNGIIIVSDRILDKELYELSVILHEETPAKV